MTEALPKLPELAITGVTGGVGGATARLLADNGLALRLLARTPSKAPSLPGCVTLPFDYADRAASEQALAGVRTVFMVSAAESADRLDQHRNFIDAAVAAGVEHVVYTSFMAAAPDATFTLARDHFATEEYVRSTPMAYTFLRDGLYLDFFELMVGDDGVLRGPAGEGRVAGVTRHDVARVAATVLTDPGAHTGATYTLTGPEALTMTEIAAVLSAAGPRSVAFHDETLPEAYASRQPWGAPDWQVDAWVSTYTAIASGELAPVSDDVERLTGRPPLSLAELLHG